MWQSVKLLATVHIFRSTQNADDFGGVLPPKLGTPVLLTRHYSHRPQYRYKGCGGAVELLRSRKTKSRNSTPTPLISAQRTTPRITTAGYNPIRRPRDHDPAGHLRGMRGLFFIMLPFVIYCDMTKGDDTWRQKARHNPKRASDRPRSQSFFLMTLPCKNRLCRMRKSLEFRFHLWRGWRWRLDTPRCGDTSTTSNYCPRLKASSQQKTTLTGDAVGWLCCCSVPIDRTT